MRRLASFAAAGLALGLCACGHPQKWANTEVMCYNPGNRTCFATYDAGTTIAYNLDQPGLFVRKNATGR